MTLGIPCDTVANLLCDKDYKMIVIPSSTAAESLFDEDYKITGFLWLTILLSDEHHKMCANQEMCDTLSGICCSLLPSGKWMFKNSLSSMAFKYMYRTDSINNARQTSVLIITHDRNLFTNIMQSCWFCLVL